jgi:phosphoribosylanthranilate isomerase
MKIKVCGLKHVNNIDELYQSGVRMMGFIFFEKSKRFIATKDRETLFAKIPMDVEKVGVFVNSNITEVINAIKEYKLDYVQLHGEESNEYCREIRSYAKVIKAFRVGEHFNFNDIASYTDADVYLFDAKGKEYGGNGIQYDWNILQQYNSKTPFLLSGGIGPDDADGINAFRHERFFGIDVNSGFEIEPGLKDATKVKTFINQL